MVLKIFLLTNVSEKYQQLVYLSVFYESYSKCGILSDSRDYKPISGAYEGPIMGIVWVRKEGGARVTRRHVEGNLRTLRELFLFESGVDIVFDKIVMN